MRSVMSDCARCRHLMFPEKSCTDPAPVFAEGGMARKFAHVRLAGFLSVPKPLPCHDLPQIADFVQSTRNGWLG